LLTADKAARDKLFAGLRERSVGTSLHFIPLHLQPAFQRNFGTRAGQFPQAEWFYDRQVALPLYPSLTNEEIHRVIDAVRQVLG
jgi:dTDP-4-amino-4,6-dideoxygalactose transaminase